MIDFYHHKSSNVGHPKDPPDTCTHFAIFNDSLTADKLKTNCTTQREKEMAKLLQGGTDYLPIKKIITLFCLLS